ncbi:PD-(D/E)XK motif protein [Nocardioides sp. NBC_00850]|uniref:PD-(D/E)XK motif protein n=1 Tax=Nocardioides sp. NBC_00850 TaxID=2976001 RepID=UPI0038631DA2|nr:PD-(D/E)XK motif protein [Nocardioides sp. NBC_00850]
MIDVSETFVLLGNGPRPEAETKILTRPLGISFGDRGVLVGIDSLGQKHLLVPARSENISSDRSSQGVVLGERTVTIGGNNISYADLYCTIPRLGLVFERLVSDVVVRLEPLPEKPVQTLRQALEDWRSLLRAASRDVDRDTIVGLVGELEFLRLLVPHDPHAALASWRGPTKSVHDFVRGGSEIEVKTTASVDGTYVSISNIDQLDPSLVDQLHLVVVHAREDETAPSLDERIDDLLLSGMSRSELLGKVKNAGYVYESDPTVNTRYAVRTVRAWRVGQNFPGIRSSDLSEERRRGVSRLRYDLVLDSAPPRMGAMEFGNLLASWLQES